IIASVSANKMAFCLFMPVLAQALGLQPPLALSGNVPAKSIPGTAEYKEAGYKSPRVLLHELRYPTLARRFPPQSRSLAAALRFQSLLMEPLTLATLLFSTTSGKTVRHTPKPNPT